MVALPARCRASLDAGLEETHAGRAQAHLKAALESVGYPKVGKPRVFPLASSLTPHQRAIAELLAQRRVRVDPFALPSTENNFRHWIDESAHDALRHTVNGEPLWRALQVHGSRVLADVPVGVAVRALAMLWSELGYVWYTHFFDKDDRGWKAFELVHPRLRDEARPWIAGYADEALEMARRLCRADVVKRRPPRWWIAIEVRWFVFVSLVRARIPIKPQWDVFFPIEGKDRKKLTFECLDAVPEARRTGAILEGLGGPSIDGYDVPVALALLRKTPSAELAAWIVEHADNCDGMSERQVLTAVAKLKNASVKTQKHELVLAYRKLLSRPGLRALTTIQRTQVERAGKEHDGQSVAASPRLTEFRESLEVGELSREDGTVAFDVLLYMSDSGSIFHTGTSRLAASVVQDGIDCGDKALCEALEQAFAGRKR